MSDLVGQVWITYRIEKLLGEGGMGRSIGPGPTNPGRAVAIKIMHPHIARQEGFASASCRSACDCVARASGIVQIYSFSRSTDMLYIAMSFIAGQSLRVWEQLLSDRQQLMAMPESLALVARSPTRSITPIAAAWCIAISSRQHHAAYVGCRRNGRRG